MKSILIFISIVLSQTSFAQHSQYKGFSAISIEISTRLAPHGQYIDMYEFVPAEGLESLLGTWISYGSQHIFKNGSPNPVNMLIWYVMFSEFSKEMGESCASPQMNLSREFIVTLNKVCAWPKASAMTDANLLEFWFAVMGYNAPESEFLEWKEFFKNSSYKSKSAKETVSAMTLAITMNPYFLLAR